MGGGIARNFIKKGYTTYVWNRTGNVSKTYKGAIVCSSPKDVAKNTDIIFEVTANDRSSKSVWLGKKGIMSVADQQKIYITCATLSIAWVDTLINTCREKKLIFFDMAMTGGRIGAETGKLTLLSGGDGRILEKIKPVLSCIAANIVRFGECGQGMRYKLILNYVQSMHIAVFGQAIKIARSLDMDIEKVADTLCERPGGVMTNMAWRDYQNKPDPINFSIDWIYKDLSYFRKMAGETDIKFLNTIRSMYRKMIKNGKGKKDWTYINQIDSIN